MKRLVILFLAIVMLAGCGAPKQTNTDEQKKNQTIKKLNRLPQRIKHLPKKMRLLRFQRF